MDVVLLGRPGLEEGRGGGELVDQRGPVHDHAGEDGIGGLVPPGLEVSIGVLGGGHVLLGRVAPRDEVEGQEGGQVRVQLDVDSVSLGQGLGLGQGQFELAEEARDLRLDGNVDGLPHGKPGRPVPR